VKFCTKCGEVYPSDVTSCNVDGAALEVWSRTSFEAKDETGSSLAAGDDDDEAEVTNVEAMPYEPEPSMATKPAPPDSTLTPGASTAVVDVHDPVTLTEFDVHSAVAPIETPNTGDELVVYDDEEVSGPFKGMIISNRYTLETRIGTGGFGVVFDAYDKQEDKRVAIKVLSPNVSDDKRTLMRFRREAIAISRLQHPGIVSISDFGIEDEGVSYIVMEFLPGRDVAVLLEEEKYVSARRAANLVMQCAEALGAAHDQGVLHRDLKPANIFVIQDENLVERTKIIDFGIAKDRSSNPRMRDITAASKVVGTPFYMSPEQASGNELDGRADVYSLGVILYELLTGKRPFEGISVYDILMAHGKAKRVKPSKIRPELKDEGNLDSIVLRAIAAKRDDRFPSMDAFAEELREYLRGARWEGSTATAAASEANHVRFDASLEGIRRGRGTTLGESSGQLKRQQGAERRRRRLPVWTYAVPILAAAAAIAFFSLSTTDSSVDSVEAAEPAPPTPPPLKVQYTAVGDDLKKASTDAGTPEAALVVVEPEVDEPVVEEPVKPIVKKRRNKRRNKAKDKGKDQVTAAKEKGIPEW
jgi:serine/threonine-protein kinase